MCKIYGGEQSFEELAAYHKDLRLRAADKVRNSADTRDLVRKTLREDPYRPSKRPTSKLYREAVKRSMTPKDLW